MAGERSAGVSDHGNYSYYVNKGCRCDACRAARAEYQRQWRAKNPGYDARMAARKRKALA